MIQMHQVSARQSVVWYKAPKDYYSYARQTRGSGSFLAFHLSLHHLI